MTDNQKKFCDEYLIDCNATRAYQAAYPRVKKYGIAKTLGSRMLNEVPAVREYINKQLELMSSKKIAEAQEVMEYLTSVMRGESESEIVVVVSCAGDSRGKRMKKRPDEKERLKAAELMGKRYGIFKENVSLDVEPITIINDLKE